jgi:hypothetical protein
MLKFLVACDGKVSLTEILKKVGHIWQTSTKIQVIFIEIFEKLSCRLYLLINLFLR